MYDNIPNLHNKRKVAINLTLIDNLNALSLIHGVDTKYAASRQDTGTRMKYFNNGIDLITAVEFRRRYRENSTYTPISPWVVLMSLSGDVEPNGTYIVRSRNRTALVASVLIDSITERGHVWPDPGLALDPKLIEYRTTHVNWRENKATIRALMPNELDLKETPAQYVEIFAKLMNRLVDEVKDFNAATNQDPFMTEEGRTRMKDFIQEILTRLGIFNESALSIRESIIAFLQHNQDPHAYIHKGVAFANDTQFQSMLNGASGNEEYVLRIQHDRPLLEAMLVEFPNDEDIPNRLRKMDRKMLDHKYFKINDTYENTGTSLDFMLGLTNDEFTEIYNTKDEDRAEELRQIVIQRWVEANKG